MKRKAWLAVILVIVIVSQLTFLTSFFHSFQADGYAVENSVVSVSKQRYVYGWASITIQPDLQQGALLVFPNGTQRVVNSDLTFSVQLPRTGDCFCNGGVSGPGSQISQSVTIAALVLSNATSFDIDQFPSSGESGAGGFFIDVYWFQIKGYASVSVSGYGVSY